MSKCIISNLSHFGLCGNLSLIDYTCNLDLATKPCHDQLWSAVWKSAVGSVAVDQWQSVVDTARSSSTPTFFDDHVVEDADDSTAVEVVSECEWTQPCRRASRPRYRQPAAGRRRQDQLADRGVVVRRPVSGRTGAVAVVRLVAVRSENPVIPADLTE